MKSLLIEIVGQQTIPSPLLHLTLQIGHIVYEFDTGSSVQRWHLDYDDSVMTHHDAAISLHNKRYLIDHSDQDLSDLCYVIESVSFDGKNVVDILKTSSWYRHCSNGYTAETIEPYTNWLGYDGKLEFRFVTPVFCWWLLNYEF